MKFDKDELVLGYGLSCIENYVMLLLKEYREDWEYIFYKSYISFDEIFKEFYIKKKQYSYFDKISRLQKVGNELKMCDIRGIRTEHIQDVFQQSSIAAICVTPEYIAEKYKTKLWRDDHFILLQNQENGLYAFINDSPKDSGYLSLEELNRIFTGEAILFEMKNIDLTNDKKEKMFQDFYISVIQAKGSDNRRLFTKDIEVELLRDILGVLRVVVKRTAAFCKRYCDVEFLDEYSDSLDWYFNKLEYIRLRKRYTLDELHEIINKINDKDIMIRSVLIERIGNVYEDSTR
jgi:hypothetical protein